MAAELSEKALRLRASIQKKIEAHNTEPGISEDLQVDEEELYRRIRDVDLDEDLGYQVSCWKQLEQMCLSKQSLERLIDNIDHIDEFGLFDFQVPTPLGSGTSVCKFGDLNDNYNELLSHRKNRLLNLRKEAKAVLETFFFDEKVSPLILQKVESVSHFLNKH